MGGRASVVKADLKLSRFVLTPQLSDPWGGKSAGLRDHSSVESGCSPPSGQSPRHRPSPSQLPPVTNDLTPSSAILRLLRVRSRSPLRPQLNRSTNFVTSAFKAAHSLIRAACSK